MSELNMMMRDAARTGLQAQLDAAVNNGEVETARKIADDISKLDLANAPKPPPYTANEIRAEMEKLDWFGTDPKKSARALELGKHLDIKKFPSAAAFAEAVVKAVDAEFPAPGGKGKGEGDDADDDDADDGDDKGKGAAEPPARKRTDGPAEGDAGAGARRRSSSGPWTKLSDAPDDVRKEVKRQTDKFAANATKEQRERFETNALSVAYSAHQRKKGK